jgi:hypothetical protein
LTTSNIHIGLAAWQTAHSYAIGKRISSGSNAYQAISSGTSGSIAPSGTASSVSDGAINWKYLSSIDYSSLTAWGNAIPNTLSSNVVALLWNDGPITTSVGNAFLVLGVSGAQRNTGVYTITVTCAPGESFKDTLKGSNVALNANQANGVCFTLPSGSGGINYFDIYDSPVIIDGIQFIDPDSTSNSTIVNANASTVTSISQCIFDGYGQSGGATMVASANVLHMSNCLIVDRDSTGNGAAVQSGDSVSTSTIINNTFVHPTTASGAIGWNTADEQGITVSGSNNLVATTGGSGGAVRSITSHASGQWYAEITISGTIGANGANGTDPIIGISNATNSLFSGPGFGTPSQSVGLFAGDQQEIFYDNNWSGAQAPGIPCSAGDVISICVDTTNDLIYFLTPTFINDYGATAWNGNSSANPATNTGGISFSLNSAAFLIFFAGGSSGAIGTLNSGGSAFVRTPPNGFLSWDTWGSTSTAGYAYYVNTASPIVRNNIFCGYTNPISGNASSALVDHCVMTSTTVGYAANVGSNQFSIVAANQFISATSDFHLKVGSVCLNTGIADPTDIPLSNDIIGYARPQGTGGWSIGAAEFTGQLAAVSAIGAFKTSANIATANNISLAKPLGAISCVSVAHQINYVAAAISVGNISIVSTSIQLNITTLAKSIGAISIISLIQNNNNASATIALNFSTIGVITSYTTAVGFSTVPPITTLAAAIAVDALYNMNSIGPIAVAAAAGQYDLAAGTFTFSLSSVALISQSIVNVRALLSLSITPLVSFLQIESASATVGIGAITSISAVAQYDLSAATISIGAISRSIAMRQDDNEYAVSTVNITCAATIGQYALASAQRSIGAITLLGGANLTYIITATPSIGAFTCVTSANQSDLLAVSVQISPFTSVSTLTNPVPATAVATIRAFSCVATAAFEDIVTGAVSIGAITCVASSAALLAASASFAISCVSTASNPYPLTATLSITPITSIGVATNLTPIPASATISVIALSSLVQFGQIDLSSALISLVVTARITVTNAPILRISQLPIEALTRGGALHVSQTSIEVASRGGALRVSQTAIEVLTQSALPSAGRVSQIVGEVLASGTPRALATQVIQEILTGGSAIQNVRMSQVVTEVLTGGSTTQNVLMTQVVLETLISAVPLNIISTTYIAV